MHRLLHSLVKWELINVEREGKEQETNQWKHFEFLWGCGCLEYRTKPQSLSAMWVFLNSFSSQAQSFTTAWMGLHQQLITLSLTASREIMIPVHLKQVYSRRTEIEGGGDWQKTLNYKKNHFGLNFSTLQITTVTMSKTQLLPSSSNNLRTFHISSWTSWETMLTPTSVQENWDLYRHASVDYTGSRNLFPCPFLSMGGQAAH